MGEFLYPFIMQSDTRESILTSRDNSAAWGFHPGGWGKPPLDDYGRPLYGDIYGVTTPATAFNVRVTALNESSTP